MHSSRRVLTLLGASCAVAAVAMPVVAVAIHGTRNVFPPGGIGMHRLPIRFEVLEVLAADEARIRSREMIAAAVGEPLAP